MKHEATMRRPAAAIIILSALCLIGCSGGLTLQSGTTGTLVVGLPASLGDSARTITPDFASEIDSISVTLDATGQDQMTQASSAGDMVTFTGLAATTWTVGVSALKSGSVIGSGSGTVIVSAGSTSSIRVPITFSGFDSGTGILALPLSWPSPTGVDYLAWSIDGGSPATADISADAGTGLSTTTLSSGLGAGIHTLMLSFKAGGSTGSPAGCFIESVDIWAGLTSGSWVDGSGTVRSAMTFSADDFLDANADLGGLVVQDGTSSGPILSLGFSSATTTYDLNEMPPSLRIVFTPTESVAGQYIAYSWNGGGATELASGSASAGLAFVTSAHDNTLAISVRAPDGTGLKTYSLIWHASGVTVGISTTPDYQALTFADENPAIAQGGSIVIETNNSTLASIASGWTWYIDGIAQAETSQCLTLDSATTSGLSVGNHSISVLLNYGGVSYSGTLILSVRSD